MMVCLRGVICAAIPLTGVSAASAQDTLEAQPGNNFVPMTASENAGIRQQIEARWNISDAARQCHKPIELRAHLGPDGTVTKVDILNDNETDPNCSEAAKAAQRAVLIASPIKLPSGKYFSSIRLRFHPEEM
jgi:hypothetical protein